MPKKEAREFRKGSAPSEWAGVEAALQYLNNGVLPPHWDRDALFNEKRNTSDDVRLFLEIINRLQKKGYFLKI